MRGEGVEGLNGMAYVTKPVDILIPYLVEGEGARG